MINDEAALLVASKSNEEFSHKPQYNLWKPNMKLMNFYELQESQFNQRYGREIIEKLKTNKKANLIELINWILSNPEWTIFTITVTFKNLVGYETSSSMKKATQYEYNTRVLTKIKKRLTRSRARWSQALPIEYLSIYEYEQGSFFKPVPRGQSPHHIHGLIVVAREYAKKILDTEKNQLDQRLAKDIQSIPTVSSFLIEPLRPDDSISWINYITKGKNAESDWFY